MNFMSLQENRQLSAATQNFGGFFKTVEIKALISAANSAATVDY